MKLLKYIIVIILIFFYKISIAQTWLEEFNTGVKFSNTGDYHLAKQHLHQAKTKYYSDTVTKDYATLLYAIGDIYFKTEVYDTSLIYFERAFELRKNLFSEDAREYENSFSRIGVVYYKLENYLKALELFKKDLTLSKKIFDDNSKEYVVVVSNLANTYNKLERYDTAEKYYINVLKLKEQIFGKESSEYSSTLTWLAELYITTQAYKKAEPLCIEAIEIRKKLSGTKHPFYINNILRLAQLYKNTCDYSKAETLYLEALSLREYTLGINHPDYISLLYDLGNFYLENGNYNQAETYLLKAANKSELLSGRETSYYIKTLNALGALYLKICDYNSAEKCFKEAITFREKQKESNPKDYATALNNMAEYYREIVNKEAFILYEKVIAIRKKIGDTLSLDYSKTISNLAIAYCMKDDYVTSESFFIKALEIIKNKAGENSPEYIQAMRNMGVFYLYFNIEKAEPYLLIALSGKSKLDKSQLIDLYSSLAILYEHRKKYLPAITYKLQSIQTRGKLLFDYSYFMTAYQLEHYFSESEKDFLSFNNYLFKYSKNFPVLCNQSYNNELQNKGLVLKSSRHVQNAIIKSGDTILINTLKDFRATKNRLSQYYSLPIDNRPAEIKELEADAEQLEKKLVKGSQAYRNLKEQFSFTWKDIQNKLGAKEAAIEFISFNYYNMKWTESVMYGALVLRPEYTEPQFVYLFEKKQLEVLLQKQPNTPDSLYFNNLYQYSKTGKSLQQLIWQPLNCLLTGVKTVYAAPSGLLHTINLTSLPVSSNMRLGQQYQLHIVGTTGDIVKREDQFLNNNTIQKAWLFGGIDYDKTNITLAKTKSLINIDFSIVAKETTRGSNNSWPFLRSTLYESAGIDSLCRQHKIQAEFISGPFASETALKNISGEPSSYILHLATHGYFFSDVEKKLEDKPLIEIKNKQDVFRLADNPLLRSGLIFSGANKSWNNPNYYSDSTDEGILTAYEVSNLDLSGAKLVVMSACETGLGEIKGSEGVFGLQRSFKLAGASNIIMSLWEVPDVQTKELMKLFYENCFKGMTVSDALKNAQFTMSEKYPPYYWAAFKLLE